MGVVEFIQDHNNLVSPATELFEELLNSIRQIINIRILTRFLKKRGNKLLVFFIFFEKLTKGIIGFDKKLFEEFKR